MAPVTLPPGACLKCKRQGLELVYTRKDAYCHNCFLLFAKSKYRRAMDAFRLELPSRQKEIKMMVAFSGSDSSFVLIDLVYTSIARTRGRLDMPVIAHVDDTEYTGQAKAAKQERIGQLMEKYPEMTLIQRSLDEVDQYTVTSPENAAPSSDHMQNKRTSARSLKECIALLSSKTSQEDILALYRDRLILETAREQGCQATLYGDSATSLAAKTLSLTAKGRGYALPWKTADHSLSHSGVWSVRPMKGLMSAEVQIYGQLMGTNRDFSETTKSTKQPGSIDELTKQYFAGLEEQFPSLVATVVRTTNKLVEPVPREQAMGDCKICGMTYQNDARQWLDNITVNAPAPEHTMAQVQSTPPEALHNEGMCFGCIVALRGLQAEIVWPTFKTDIDGLPSRKHDASELLAEYEVVDDI